MMAKNGLLNSIVLGVRFSKGKIMKIALGSDLHLEFDVFEPVNPGADVLVLAGDILVAADLHDYPRPDAGETIQVNLGKRQKSAYAIRNFLDSCSKQFSDVVIIAGNHEFYHGHWVKTLNVLKYETSYWPNVHFLENRSVKIGDVWFLGATMWTDVGRNPLAAHVVEDGMNDYSAIRHDGLNYRRLRVTDTVRRHVDTITWLKAELAARSTQPTVVVSHHAPTSMSVSDKFKSDSLMNLAYYSDLSNLILDNPQIKYWFHGHMHDPSDYMVGDCRVVANPRGYVGYERDSHVAEPYHFQVLEV